MTGSSSPRYCAWNSLLSGTPTRVPLRVQFVRWPARTPQLETSRLSRTHPRRLPVSIGGLFRLVKREKLEKYLIEYYYLKSKINIFAVSITPACVRSVLCPRNAGVSCGMVRGRVARRSKSGACSAMELPCCSGRQHDAEDVRREESRGGHHGETQSGATTRTHTGDGTPA